MAKDNRQIGFGVIGLGRFGSTLVKTLAQAGQEVIAVDSNEAKVREARAYTDAAFVTTSLDKETLMQIGMQNCDTVIIAIGEKLDTSILTTLTVKQLGVRRVIAKAISEDHAAVLEKLGAEVISPESDMAIRLAKKLTARRVMDFLSLEGDVEITEVTLPDVLAGKTIATSNLRGRFGLNIIAIVRPSEIITDITPEHRLAKNDVIVVIGKRDHIETFENTLCTD